MTDQPTEPIRPEDIRPGDWVRFMQDGHLIIGVVQYSKPASVLTYFVEHITDVGSVQADRVLEVRRG